MFEKTYIIQLKYNKENFQSNDIITIQSHEDINFVKLQCAAKYGLDNIISIKQAEIKKF